MLRGSTTLKTAVRDVGGGKLTASVKEQRKQDVLNRLEHDTDAWVAWQEVNEIEDREFMRGGRWLVP